MKPLRWHTIPFILLTFLYFLALGTAEEALAKQEQRQDVLDERERLSTRPISSALNIGTTLRESEDGSDDEPVEEKGAEALRQAMAILHKIPSTSGSGLARYGHRPKGFLQSVVYYAKEAFVLLFMTSPTSGSPSSSKLAPLLSNAIGLLRDAAAEDNADAIYLLADINFHGNYSHPINYSDAFDRYRQLADLNGNSTAHYMLAFMYATGLNPNAPADQAKAMLYHTFAAEGGDTRSEMTLAYRNHAGIATTRNCDEAVHWYKRVADKAVSYYRSGPPGGHVLIRDSYRLADEEGGVYGEGASVSSSGIYAKQGGPTSDNYASIEDVMEYLHMQASKGDLKARFSMARLYYDGSRGLKRDPRLAKKHFLALARLYWTDTGKVVKGASDVTEMWATRSAAYLGRMFLRGEGMEQSYARAKIWFTRGIANGDPLCHYSMGLMHLNGLGVEQNIEKAADLFSAAAEANMPVAQTNLGILFLDQGDTAAAAKWFELGAQNSHIEAFYYLAEMNENAIGRDRSCPMAVAYYKIVAEKAEAVWSSVHEANNAYEAGDMQKALIGYLMAAEQGSENAQANVAWLLDRSESRWSPLAWFTTFQRNVKLAFGDASTALMYWTRSAKQNNIDSRVKMGDYYLAGLGVPVSEENAATCYQAATADSAQAMWNLGWMHENGLGIDQDFHLAKRFYDQALETNKEAYLPVKLSLWKLRWRSWWNHITRGGIHGIEDEEDLEKTKKKRSFAEWLHDFLEADAEAYHAQLDGDDDFTLGSDDFYYDDELDDSFLDLLIIGGLFAALGWLIYYRQQQQRIAEERRRAGLQDAGQQQPPPPAAEQQPDRGFFPQPGDPAWNAWLAGGVAP